MLETHSTKLYQQAGGTVRRDPAARVQWINTVAILQLFSKKNAHVQA